MSSLQLHFRSMARNNLWSNHRLHRACGRLSPEERAENRGAFFGSIVGTLNHILLVDRWFLGRLTGRLPEPMLAHLFVHQIHHRGQVHQMLCTTDASAPQLDEFFLSSDAALRAAEIDELGLRR